MKEAFKTVFEGGFGEIVMKKSRFIASVYPVETEEEALQIIEAIKKKYWDASHNCSAYIIGNDQNIMRCSDDGEPSKTAGKPMLDILIAHQLTNILVVVTRYFGGTLLGTGGLVKAYQAATQEGLSQCKIITKKIGMRSSLTTDYNLVGKLQYYFNQEQLTVLSSEYADNVRFELLVPTSLLEEFTKKIAELTNGSAIVDELDQVYFTVIDGEVHLFDSCS